jgi:hypothetical protein
MRIITGVCLRSNSRLNDSLNLLFWWNVLESNKEANGVFKFQIKEQKFHHPHPPHPHPNKFFFSPSEVTPYNKNRKLIKTNPRGILTTCRINQGDKTFFSYYVEPTTK